jgi:Flp pilus assembly protein TadG
LVEFAVVATFLFIVIFAFVEFGRVYMVEEALDHAARAGVRQAAVPGESTQSVLTAIATAVQQLKIDNTKVSASVYLNQYNYNSSTGTYSYANPGNPGAYGSWGSAIFSNTVTTSSSDTTLGNAPRGSLIQIQVSVPYSAISWSPLPVVFNSGNTFTATATMRRE